MRLSDWEPVGSWMRRRDASNDNPSPLLSTWEQLVDARTALLRPRPNPCGHVNPTAVLCHVCGPRNYALVKGLMDRLAHAACGGVELWPEYRQLKAELLGV